MPRLLPLLLVFSFLLPLSCASRPAAETDPQAAAEPAPAPRASDTAAQAAGGAEPADAHSTEPPESALVAELPFLVSEETNRIYLDLAPPDYSRRLRILLDTGAQFSAFSPLAAREAGIRVRRVKSTPYRRSTVLGRDLVFWVDTSSSDQGTRMGWEYGLLGGNFLEHYVFELDFPGRRVRFFDPDRYQIPESAPARDEAVVPLQVVGRRPMVEVSINGTKVPVLIDTGAPFGLMVSGDVSEEAGIREKPAQKISTGMILGPVETLLSEVERLELGPFALERAPVLVAPQGLYNWAGQANSLLGYDVLAEFVVRFDYRNQRMWLRRAPESRRTFQGGDWALYREHGVLLVPAPENPGNLSVLVLKPGSPAAERGLAPGDVMLEVEDPAAAVEALAGPDEVWISRRNDEGIWVDQSLRPPVAAPPSDDDAGDSAGG